MGMTRAGPTTAHQIVYAALDRALTGPKNGDPRRDGSSSDRAEYLTDAVMNALLEAGRLK